MYSCIDNPRSAEEITVESVLATFSRRLVPRVGGHQRVCEIVEAYGVTVDDTSRKIIYDHVQFVQAQRAERRRQLLRKFATGLKQLSAVELQARLQKVTTQTARSAIKQALHIRRERDLHLASQLREEKFKSIAPSTNTKVRAIYRGSNAAASKKLYRTLSNLGAHGRIATELLRAQKSSSRAKSYRGCIGFRGGDTYSDVAYDRKELALASLCQLLECNSCGWTWGWKPDHAQPRAPWVLYIELPTGQVSFHCVVRLDGPDFVGDWDGTHLSEQRILAFCESLLGPEDMDG